MYQKLEQCDKGIMEFENIGIMDLKTQYLNVPAFHG